jgi:hypothetical protein
MKSTTCPSCNKTLKVPASYVGRTIKCPGCNRSLNIQGADSSPDGSNANLLDKNPRVDKHHKAPSCPRPAKTVQAARLRRAKRSGQPSNTSPVTLIIILTLFVGSGLGFYVGVIPIPMQLREVLGMAPIDDSTSPTNTAFAKSSTSFPTPVSQKNNILPLNSTTAVTPAVSTAVAPQSMMTTTPAVSTAVVPPSTMPAVSTDVETQPIMTTTPAVPTDVETQPIMTTTPVVSTALVPQPKKIKFLAIKEIPIISSGFEGDVHVMIDLGRPYATLKGADRKFPHPNSWSKIGEGIAFDFLIKGYVGKSSFEITPDPVRPRNRVLKTQVINKGDAGINGRAQGSLFSNGRHDLQHFRFKQFISKDYQLLVDIPQEMRPQWTDFFEIWSPICSTNEEVSDNGGAFRVNYAFEPDRKGGFQWHLTGHNMSGKKSEIYQGWHRTNADIDIPFGKWCEWDVLIVKGNDPKTNPDSRAQVLIKMRPEGQKDWTTLFDVQDERTAHSRISQKGWYQVAPFKNYMGSMTVEWLLAKGATDISFYFDDFSYSVGEVE